MDMSLKFNSKLLLKRDDDEKVISCFTNAGDALHAFNELLSMILMNDINPDCIKSIHVKKDKGFYYEDGEIFLSDSFIQSMILDWERFVSEAPREMIDANNHPAWMLSNNLNEKAYTGFHHCNDHIYMGWAKRNGQWIAINVVEKKLTFSDSEKILSDTNNLIECIAKILISFSGKNIREEE